MRKLPKKLLITGIALLLSVVVLGGVSFAWYTISTTPEASAVKVGIYADRTILISSDGENFGQYVNLSDAFQNLIGLHPVSTVDGLNWFLPAYQVEGMLMEAKEFILDDRLEHANISALDDEGNPLEGDELNERDKEGYYYYVDFYLMTQVEDGCTVHLSFPEADSFDDLLTDEGIQGTYILGQPILKVKDGEETLKLSYGGENCIRIGFLTNPAYSEASGLDNTGYSDIYPKNGFVIYEPNSDIRTSTGKPGSGEQDQAGRYVLGNDFSAEVFQNGNYLETKPLGFTLDSNGKTVIEPVTIDPAKLIIQKSSSWDEEDVLEKLRNRQKVTSAEILNYGYFISSQYVTDRLQTSGTASRYVSILGEAGQNGSDVSIIHLIKDEPVKVRMFIWLEGQDPDCWNDIAGSAFRMNLELTGRE